MSTKNVLASTEPEPGAAPEIILATSVDGLKAEISRRAGYKFARYFPDCTSACVPGSLDRLEHVTVGLDGTRTLRNCRVLYQKHLMFFAAGLTYRQRLFMAANRVGKTEGAGYELTCHLTGLYPDWWVGRRFSEPGEWWVAGDTGETTRDILQAALWGPLDAPGTGMLPAHLITHRSLDGKGAVDTMWIRHVTGGTASLQFKAFDQGRRTFQGTGKQGIWLDEEAPGDIVTECLLRLMTTEGLLLLTFTPLNGLTPFIQEYLETALLETGEGMTAAKGAVFGDGGPAPERPPTVRP